MPMARFTVFAIFQQKLDTVIERGFYQVYGEDGQPWVTVVTWNAQADLVTLWVQLLTNWYNLGLVTDFRLNKWIHVCLDIDTQTSQMTVAVNGKPLNKMKRTSYPELRQENPKDVKHKLTLGSFTHVDEHKQYYWSVTNLNIFYGAPNQNMTALTHNLCEVQGDYFAWSDMAWTRTGDQVTETNLDQEIVCGQTETYQLAVAVQMGGLGHNLT